MAPTQQYALETIPILDKLAFEPAPVRVSDVALPTLEHFNALLPENVDAKAVASEWFSAFSAAVEKGSPEEVASLFVEDAFWRDMLALTWEFRTIHAKQPITKFLSATLPESGFSKLTLRADSVMLLKPYPDMAWIQGFFDFETKVGIGMGIFRIVPTSDGGPWKALVVYTNLEDLKGFPERLGPLRDYVPIHGKWPEKRRREINFEDTEPAVVILGGGQSGLEVSARLKMLGIPSLIIDRNPRVGDNWRGRYEALCLHDPVWYDHMPYLPFPPNWPVYTPAPKLADWLESYAHTMELNVWNSSTIEKMVEVPGKGWSVLVKRGDGTTRTFTPRHVIFAHGFGGGQINMPKLPGMEDFAGKIIHSSQHKSAKDHAGKKVVVVGACTSGHDIAHDHYLNGVDVTIFQRSSSYIMSNKNGMPILMRDVYWEGPLPTDVADRVFASFPLRLLRLMHRRVAAEIAEADKDLLEGLKARGFKLNFNKDNSGFLMQAFEKGGGYYLDVGASQLVADGKIKLKNDSQISHFTKNAIVFENGSELPADVVIFATGYGDPKVLVRELVGDEVANRVSEKVWGLNDEGEFNACWRWTGVEGLYHMMGNLALCRFHSKHLALQIKAKEEGIFGKRYEEKVNE